MTRLKALSCGGKGPCCHVGYSHRHCEHCDVVIDTRTAHDFLPYYNRPYITWQAGGTAARPPNFLDTYANAAMGSRDQSIRAFNTGQAAQDCNTVDVAYADHLCEVK